MISEKEWEKWAKEWQVHMTHPTMKRAFLAGFEIGGDKALTELADWLEGGLNPDLIKSKRLKKKLQAITETCEYTAKQARKRAKDYKDGYV